MKYANNPPIKKQIIVDKITIGKNFLSFFINPGAINCQT